MIKLVILFSIVAGPLAGATPTPTPRPTPTYIHRASDGVSLKVGDFVRFDFPVRGISKGMTGTVHALNGYVMTVKLSDGRRVTVGCNMVPWLISKR